MVKVPAFSDIGKTAKELLYGGRQGTFQYNKSLTVSSVTADGVEFSATALNKDDKLDTSLKATYRSGNYSLTTGVGTAGKVTLSGSASNIAPGLSATVSGSLPDQSSAKLAVDYSVPYLTLKSAVGMTASPKVDVSATTGYEGTVLGGDLGYDTNKGAITRWSVAAGYTAADYQAALVLTDLGETVKFSYAQHVDPTATVGAEVIRSLTKETTAFTLGYAKKLEGGALAKIRLENTGVTSVLYEQELHAKTVVALSGQFDATNLDKAPKFGMAFNMKN